ncbi:hypothetical protein PG994_009999 [Apiospora phragmitis]|uniref:RRM domain-containing protein n=1 Tax=Apiospora phragmitis TaxID=2905665 RepID=A0ABR1TNN0_9PEZI
MASLSFPESQLKDHVRTVCAVERVEIFNESTSGWVSVRGPESFNIALKFLSTKLFNGRPTFADGRNAQQRIPIKKLVDASLPDPKAHSTQAPWCRPSPPILGYNSSTLLSIPPVAGTTQTTPLKPLPIYPVSPWYPEPVSSITSPPGSYRNPPQLPPSYNDPAEYQSPTTASCGQVAAPDKVQNKTTVNVEWRKIVIKGLPSWTPYKDVRTLLITRAGLEAVELSYIRLFVKHNKSSGKCHATVILGDEKITGSVIKKLHGCYLDGRKLTVELAKEGVSVDEERRKRGEHGYSKKKCAKYSSHSSKGNS